MSAFELSLEDMRVKKSMTVNFYQLFFIQFDDEIENVDWFAVSSFGNAISCRLLAVASNCK